MKNNKPTVIIIGGPTASGKSALGLMLAKQLNGAIINGDSQQLYRDLPILTACPSPQEQLQAPHHLYQLLSPTVAPDIYWWRKQVEHLIPTVHQDGQIPIIVGGSGFYLYHLLHNILELPPIPEKIRSAIRESKSSLAEMYTELQRLDPELAGRLKANDQYRIKRGLEVYYATKRPLSSWQQQQTTQSLQEKYNIIVITIAPEHAPERAELYARIDSRLEQMITNGAIDQLQALLEQYSGGKCEGKELPILKVLGAREFQQYIMNERSLESALSCAQQNSRRYAKRQMTWFRNKMPRDYVLHKISDIPSFADTFAENSLPFAILPHRHCEE